MLPFHDPLRYIGKYRGADVSLLGVGVGQSIADSFGNERLYGSVAVLAEAGHSYADNENLFHRVSSFGTAKQTKREPIGHARRSEEHTSELQSLMRISYAVFCLKKKKNTHQQIKQLHTEKN